MKTNTNEEIKVAIPHLAGLANKGIASTPLFDDVADEMFLSVVSCQDGNLISWITKQAHVHKYGDGVLRFP